MNFYKFFRYGIDLKNRIPAKILLIMKLTTILLFATFIQVSASVNAQKITLKYEGASLEKVIRNIKQQTGYHFFYSNNMLKEALPVTINISNVSLETALQKIFNAQPLTYTVEDKTIVVKLKPAVRPGLLNIIPITVQKAIYGRVTDSGNQPVVGASVVIAGTRQGTFTDSRGAYRIAAKAGDVLQFSYVGYKTKEVTVGQNDELNVQLTANPSSLNDLIIVGYGMQKSSKVTGAISTVKMDNVLGDRPVSTVSSLLQNVVPGLNISVGSGQPGSSTSLNIRGATDINTSGSSINTSGPLILVDNVPFNGPLNMLDPNDIETVTVLKDAGSAAIYGGRSAFGVILITTKQGKKNQRPRFNFSNNVTLASATNLPVKASPDAFLQALEDMGTTTFWSGQDVATWKTLYDSIKNPASQFPNGVDYYNGAAYPLVATDMVRNLLGSSVPQIQNNFSVSGGSDKTTYRFSFGNTNEKGIINPKADVDYMKRYNVASALSTDVTSWLTTQLNTSYYNEKLSTPDANQFATAVNYPALAPVSDSLTATNGVSGINATPKNIVASGGTDITQNRDVRITGRAILKPLKGLTITGEYTYDNLKADQENYSKLVTYVNPTNFQVQPQGSGAYSLSTATTAYKALNVYGNYMKSIGDNNLSFIAGYNQEENIATSFSSSRTGMISPDYPSLVNATGPTTSSNGYSAYALLGFFGRINYDYKGKYLLEVNGRYDGTSKFPPGHRFGFFPSGSLGWRMSDENFMKSLKPVLSDFKLRASYGSVGNQNINPYQFIPTFPSYKPNWLNGTGAYLSSLTSPSLISSSFTWETVNTLNYGADFGLFSQHLTGSFEWYVRNTTHILAAGAAAAPAILGTGYPLENTASIRSRGFELTLSYKDHVGKDISYYVSANLSDNTGVVTKFVGNATNQLSTYYVGQHIGEIWGYVTDGFYTTDDFVSGSLSSNLTGGTLNPGVVSIQGVKPNPGDIKYKDLDGNGIINPGLSTLDSAGDRRIIGNNNPRYIFGVNGGITYKGITFSFVVSGVGKQQNWMANNLTFPNYYQFGTIYANELNYWTPTRTNAYFGRIYDQAAGNQGVNQRNQTKFLQNWAYLRINNLTLDYAFPDALVKPWHINALHVFCSVENPFLFDHLPDGIEPGLSGQGSGLQYPYLRKTSFGLNLSF